MGRGNEFGLEVDLSQTYNLPYGIPGYSPNMMGYQMGYQAPYGFGFMGGYPYGFPQQFHPGYQMQPGAAFDPRQQAMHFQMSHAHANRNLSTTAPRYILVEACILQPSDWSGQI